MKNLIYIAIVAMLFASCQEPKTETKKTSDDTKKETAVVTKSNDDGYQLMKQYCFTCHFEKMDRSKKGKMIAPPMMMVQRHYKPSYPNKKDFAAAIVKWVNKPNEDDIKMPGATRKFGLMPALPIGDDKLTKIAEALFDMDFGNMAHGNNMHKSKISLNNGKKWQLQKADVNSIKEITTALKSFKSDNLTDYHQLGESVFNKAKKLLLNKSYDKATTTQVHNYFHTIESDIHKLIGAKSISDAEQVKTVLLKKLSNFSQFFE